MENRWQRLGALIEAAGVRFRLWAPTAPLVEVLVLEDSGGPPRAHALTPAPGGYHETLVFGLRAGARYRYRLGPDREFPDPASRFQPEGVHGPSEVVDLADHRWGDAGWPGVPRERLLFYELHVGTFSPEGTFDGARRLLPRLAKLGVTAVELMPVADFVGRWNWGYDGGALWAPSRAYGRPAELRALVDEAHRLGMAVVLDVVYNHFGPDGAYVTCYGPYLTDRHRTLWGQAVNLDSDGSSEVRAFFIANARHWLEEYHFDGLRLDATFAMHDDSPRHFLADLADAVREVPGPRRYVIAEDYRNLDYLIRPDSPRSYGLDGVWADDFHHLVRRILAGDTHSYYQDYPASTAALATAIQEGWLYTGQYSAYEGKPRGTDPTGLPKDRLVFCIQNHDQIGNRPFGERLSHDVDPGAYRAASALLLFLPEIPLLFMGQEWAASTPFLYFTDHAAELGRRVTEGRREEFRDAPVAGEVPDPQAPPTFRRSRLRWEETEMPPHAGVLRLYRELIRRRGELTGAVRAESPVDGALIVRRGRHTLVVALRPELTVEVGEGALCWHTESPEYSENPAAPRLDGHRLHFIRPAAAVLLGPQRTPRRVA